MLRAFVLGVAVCVALSGGAQAQFAFPGLDLPTAELTPAQQNQRVIPFKRALTFCVIRQAQSDDAAPLAFRDGSFDAYVVTLIDRCQDDRRNLVQAYNATYGPGQAGAFINGAYAEDLPHAVLKRIRPQIEAKVADLKRTEAAQAEREAQERADAYAREAQAKEEAAVRQRQAEADRQREAAEAEQQASIARAEADKAQAQERAAAEAAETERLKQVEIANGAAKLLAIKALDCGRDQLKTLVKSGESAEVLASAVMTMCDSDVDHFIEAGLKEYRLEHKLKTDDDVGLARAKMRSDTREQIVALAVQAKAGAGAFAPASSN